MSIVDHEFSDSIANVRCTNANEQGITLKLTETPWVFFDRDDVIAMAKHFNLTDKDLSDEK